VDEALLMSATPYAWSEETMRAVIAASKSIPLDTAMNHWNLHTAATFWHFATPLPFKTLLDDDRGIRALGFGWIKTQDRSFGLPVHTWLDDDADGRFPIVPSATFEWGKEDTLGTMLAETRAHHMRLYGPGGKWADKPHTTIESFMESVEGIARFMLAGIAWLEQKVLVTDDGHAERHRRKEFNRQTGQDLRFIKVVQLRKNDYGAREHAESDVEWSCRWAVSGHWRNQACGPNHRDRKLCYIMPYVKGPADKPFREAPMKVYEVKR
jgi:hypothetical protein